MWKELPEGGLVLNSELPDDMRSLPWATIGRNLENTVLDRRLEWTPGYIPLKDGVIFHHPDHVEEILGWRPQSWTGKGRISRALERKGRKLSEVSHTTRGDYLMVPTGIQRQYIQDTGVAIIDDLQRSTDALIRHYHRYTGSIRNRAQYQGYYEDWLGVMKAEILGKGAALDQITGVLHPYSGRAVTSCDPTIPLDSVSIPASMVIGWMKSEEFREAYGLMEGLRSGLSIMRGKLILVSRFPTHNQSSILAMKLRTHRGSTIRFNPTLADGILGMDYDGRNILPSS